MGKGTDAARKPPARRRPVKKAADPTGDDAALRLALREAHARQAATAEILQAISTSAGDLTRVFAAILDNALKLCNAEMGHIYRVDRGILHPIVARGVPPAYEALLHERGPRRPDPRSPPAESIRLKKPVVVDDLRKHVLYAERTASVVAMVEEFGLRTLLHVPLLYDAEAVGLIVLYRRVVQPFTEKHIDLVSDFATQAVIAIENARLLTELQESLDRQIATSEVLSAISRTPGQLEPIFNTMIENATRLCRAEVGTLAIYDEGAFHGAAVFGHASSYADTVSRLNAPTGTGLSLMEQTMETVQIDDVAAVPAYDEVRQTNPDSRRLRTALYVPICMHSELIGAFMVYRHEVRPFDEKQVDLVEGFADQAAIAIENARLLEELRESLDRQTATSEVLGAISSSPGELQPVFEAMLENAVRICGGRFGMLAIREQDGFRGAATHGVGPIFAETLSHHHRPVPGTTLDVVMQKKETIQIADCAAEPAYDEVRALNPDHAKVRTHLCVPMLRENELIGAILIYRDQVLSFTDKQIELVENFADQAVIAIENARLLEELNTRNRDLAASLEQQTATAEIMRAIASTPDESTEIFETIVTSAQRLLQSDGASIMRIDGGTPRRVAVSGLAAQVSELLGIAMDRGSPGGRAIIDKCVVHVEDLLREPEEFPAAPGVLGKTPTRTVLAAPLMRESEPIGAIALQRADVRPFVPKEIELLKSFADQAVIAIENARLLSELRESLQNQTASAEILRTIAASPEEPDKALDTIAQTTARLFGASSTTIRMVHGDRLRIVGSAGPAAIHLRATVGEEYTITPDTLPGATVLGNRPIHIPDIDNPDPDIAHWPGLAPNRAAGVRTLIGMPLMRKGEAIGAMMVQRGELKPFTEKEIAQLANFADQAVIAIENARILEELRESLDRQTATSEVLGAISSSPGELAPVFDAILSNGLHLCDASMGHIYRLEDGALHLAAISGGPPEYEAFVRDRGAYPLEEDMPHARAVREKAPLQIPDLRDRPLYASGHPGTVAAVELAAARTALFVPLLRGENPLGIIIMYRSDVRPFGEKQIALVEDFADQAVIAIENARLLEELNTRNRDLAESLEQQTATAEILRTIASAPGEAEQALDTIARTTARMFDALGVSILQLDSGALSIIGSVGPASEIIRQDNPTFPLDRSNVAGTAALDRRQIYVEDIEALPEDAPVRSRALLRKTNVRSVVGTPLMREGDAIGVLVVQRTDPHAFDEADLKLLERFADQAVIAIENARLLNELRESLDRRTAIAEVLHVISSSPGDVQPVFEAMLHNAIRLCDATEGSVFSVSGNTLRRIANRGLAVELAGFYEVEAEPGTPHGRMLSTRKSVHVPDMLEMLAELPELRDTPTMAGARAATERGARAALLVPMIKDGVVVGAFVLHRRETRPFTAAQIGLVETFASQAVIAIENARLLSELRSARDEAERALGELKAAQANLIQAEKMASLGQLTAGIAHEIKNPLNFVNNFAGLSVELLDELKAELGGDRRDEVGELIGMLTGNLEKVAEHGRRADGIVKSMLAHSRGGSGDRQNVDLNALVEESLNLAYHGARAQDQNFNVTMERELDPSLGPIEVVPQDLTRVFLNLFGNGFYAANKRFKEASDAAFRPAVKVTTQDLGADVVIRIRDNGAGIPPEMRPRLFEPFFTTKPTGEGTGLGLSISYEIVTKEHGGSIEVESVPGEFTEFRIRIPKRAGSEPGARP